MQLELIGSVELKLTAVYVGSEGFLQFSTDYNQHEAL